MSYIIQLITCIFLISRLLPPSRKPRVEEPCHLIPLFPLFSPLPLISFTALSLNLSLPSLLLPICSKIKELKNAIENDFFFEMFIDDLPMWGYLGEVSVPSP